MPNGGSSERGSSAQFLLALRRAYSPGIMIGSRLVPSPPLLPCIPVHRHESASNSPGTPEPAIPWSTRRRALILKHAGVRLVLCVDAIERFVRFRVPRRHIVGQLRRNPVQPLLDTDPRQRNALPQRGIAGLRRVGIQPTIQRCTSAMS